MGLPGEAGTNDGISGSGEIGGSAVGSGSAFFKDMLHAA
jgi:hypothetical protein